MACGTVMEKYLGAHIEAKFNYCLTKVYCDAAQKSSFLYITSFEINLNCLAATLLVFSQVSRVAIDCETSWYISNL